MSLRLKLITFIVSVSLLFAQYGTNGQFSNAGVFSATLMTDAANDGVYSNIGAAGVVASGTSTFSYDGRYWNYTGAPVYADDTLFWPPNPVKSLTLAVVSNTNVWLRWIVPTNGSLSVAGYKIYRADAARDSASTNVGVFSSIATLTGASWTNYTNWNVPTNRMFAYYVAPYDTTNQESTNNTWLYAFSSNATIYTNYMSFSLTRDASGVSIGWTGSNSFTQYYLYRMEAIKADTTNGMYLPLYTGTGLAYRDYAVQQDRVYYYKLQALSTNAKVYRIGFGVVSTLKDSPHASSDGRYSNVSRLDSGGKEAYDGKYSNYGSASVFDQSPRDTYSGNSTYVNFSGNLVFAEKVLELPPNPIRTPVMSNLYNTNLWVRWVTPLTGSLSVSGYKVYGAAAFIDGAFTNIENYTLLATLSGSTKTNYTNTNFSTNLMYAYKIVPYDAENIEATNNTVIFYGRSNAVYNTNLQTVTPAAGIKAVAISITTNAAYTNFIVYKSAKSNGQYTRIAATATNYFREAGVTATGYYRIFGMTSLGGVHFLGTKAAGPLAGMKFTITNNNGLVIKGTNTSTLLAKAFDTLTNTNVAAEAVPLTVYYVTKGGNVEGQESLTRTLGTNGSLTVNFVPGYTGGVNTIRMSSSDGFTADYDFIVGDITFTTYASASTVWVKTNGKAEEILLRIEARYSNRSWPDVEVHCNAANGHINSNTMSVVYTGADGSATVTYKPTNVSRLYDTLYIQSPAATVLKKVYARIFPLPESVPGSKGYPVPDVYTGLDQMSVQGSTADPVNHFTGNFRHTAEDVSLKTMGFPIAVRRVYNSINPMTNIFGYGWTFNYNERLRVVTENGDVNAYFYRGDGATLPFFKQNATTGLFTSLLGCMDTLSNAGGGTYRLFLKENASYYFDANGNRTKIVWKNIETRFAYNISNQLTNVLDVYSGRAISIGYYSNGLVSNVIDPLSNYYRYSYDIATNLTNVRGYYSNNVEFYSATYRYGSNHELTNIAEPRAPMGQKQRLIAYDSFNNVMSTMDVLGKGKTTYAFDVEFDGLNEQFTTVMKDSLDRSSKDIYSREGFLVKRYDTAGAVESFEFTNGATMTRMIDKNGGTNDYRYNWHFDMIRKQDAAGAVTSFAYGKDTGGQTYDYTLVTRLTNPDNKVTVYEYDTNGNIAKITYPDTTYETFAHDVSSLMTNSSDRNRNVTAYAYDAFGNLTNIIYPAAGFSPPPSVSYSYDIAGRRTNMIDMNGNSTTYYYNGLNLITNIRYHDTSTLKMLYDTLGRLTNTIDEESKSKYFAYGVRDEVTNVIDENKATNRMRYLDNGLLAAVIDGRQAVTTNIYDAANRLIGVMNASNGIRRFGYDSNGNMITITNEGLAVTGMEYDRANRMVRTYDPYQNMTEVTYDVLGRATRVTFPDTTTNGSCYDVLGRVRTNIDAEGKFTELVYDNNGNIITSYDKRRKPTRYRYDALNRIVAITNALGGTTTFEYDRNGNRISIAEWYESFSKSNVTRFKFDTRNRLVAVTNATNNYTLYAYDLRGLVTNMRDNRGYYTTFFYDNRRQLTNVRDHYGSFISFAYDENGNRTNITDKNTNRTRFIYDALNRLSITIDALSGSNRAIYDAVGNTIQTIDVRDTTNSFVYDSLGRLTMAFGGNGITTNRFVYDMLGRQTCIYDTLGNTVSNVYSPAGLLLRVIDAMTNTNAYAYDANGNVIAVTNKRGFVTSITYDDLNRATNIVNPATNTNAFVFDDLGRLTNAIDPAGTNRFEYDTLNRLVKRIDALTNSTTMEYDENGNMLKENAPISGIFTAYAYDALNRLTRVTNALSGVTEIYYDANGNKTRVVDQRTNSTYYFYDALNRLTATSNILTNVTRYKYDRGGNLTNLIDPNLMTNRFFYDALSRVTNAVDPLGYGVRYTYDPRGLVSKVIDKMTNTTTNAYDALGRLVSTVDALTNITRYFYDANGNMTNRIDARDVSQYTAYDALDRITAVTDAYTNAVQYVYDRAGRVTNVVDKMGFRTSMRYDALGRRTMVIDALTNTNSVVYDAVGRVITQTNADTTYVQYAYDELSRLTNRTYMNGGSERFTYDANGNITRAVNMGTNAVDYYYDAANRLTAATNVLSIGVQYQYDANGNRTAVIDGRGYTNKFTYTARGELASVEDPLTNKVSYVYNAGGMPVYTIDPRTNTNTTVYDALGRVKQTKNPLGAVTVYNYDRAGNLTNLVDRNTNSTFFGYDLIGRMTNRIDALTNIVVFAYNANNNLIQRTLKNAANGGTADEVFTFGYDKLGRLTNETDPLTYRTSVRYDVMGRVIERVKPANERFTYLYDLFGHCTNEKHYDALGANTVTVAYTYNATGAVTKIADNNVELGYTYDSIDRPVRTYTKIGAVTKYLSNAFDNNNNRTLMVDYESRTNTYTYDPANRLTTLLAQSLWNSRTLTNVFGYNAAGLRDFLVLPNGMTNRYTYDIANRVTNITFIRTNNILPIDSISYGYDSSDNMLQRSNRNGTESYAYDRIYRLTNVQYTTPAYEQFMYDAAGNRTNHVIYDTVTTNRTSYTYDAANRLISSVMKITNVTHETVTYAYSKNGDLTNRIERDYATPTTETTNIAYYQRNPDGRIARIDITNMPSGGPVTSLTNEFTYSVLLQRIKRVESTGTNYYLYDGDNAIYVYGDSFLTNVKQRIIHGLSVDTPIAAEAVVGTWPPSQSSNVMRFYHLTETCNKVAYIVDEDQNIIQAYIYRAFGTVGVVGTYTNLYTYTGREFDRDSGLYYYRSRHYDPRNGRFDRVDDVRDGLNWYVYCQNNPLMYVDAFGKYYYINQLPEQRSIRDGNNIIIAPNYGRTTLYSRSGEPMLSYRISGLSGGSKDKHIPADINLRGMSFANSPYGVAYALRDNYSEGRGYTKQNWIATFGQGKIINTQGLYGEWNDRETAAGGGAGICMHKLSGNFTQGCFGRAQIAQDFDNQALDSFEANDDTVGLVFSIKEGEDIWPTICGFTLKICRDYQNKRISTEDFIKYTSAYDFNLAVDVINVIYDSIDEKLASTLKIVAQRQEAMNEAIYNVVIELNIQSLKLNDAANVTKLFDFNSLSGPDGSAIAFSFQFAGSGVSGSAGYQGGLGNKLFEAWDGVRDGLLQVVTHPWDFIRSLWDPSAMGRIPFLTTRLAGYQASVNRAKGAADRAFEKVNEITKDGGYRDELLNDINSIFSRRISPIAAFGDVEGVKAASSIIHNRVNNYRSILDGVYENIAGDRARAQAEIDALRASKEDESWKNDYYIPAAEYYRDVINTYLDHFSGQNGFYSEATSIENDAYNVLSEYEKIAYIRYYVNGIYASIRQRDIMNRQIEPYVPGNICNYGAIGVSYEKYK